METDGFMWGLTHISGCWDYTCCRGNQPCNGASSFCVQGALAAFYKTRGDYPNFKAAWKGDTSYLQKLKVLLVMQ